MRRIRSLIFTAAIAAIPAVTTASAQDKPPVASPPPPAAGPASAAAAVAIAPLSAAMIALKGHLNDRHIEATQEERDAAIAFYSARNGNGIFASPQGITDKGKGILDALKGADAYGLPAAELTPAKLDTTATALDGDALPDTEARLALAALKYARYARGGRIPEPSKQLASYLDRAPQYAEPKSVLEALASASDVKAALQGYNPQAPQFEALRKAYNEARAAEGSEPPDAPLPEVKLKAGMTHPGVAAVRKLLKVEPATDHEGKLDDPQFFDPALVAAVQSFQTANGLEPADGIVGAKTRAALTSLKRPTARTLLANMEEWRWMPADLGAIYVNVNIPEFAVRVVENGKVIHQERVVTGLVDHQTPVFSDKLQTVVLQPDWVLPKSIKVNEALPSLFSGGGMFYSNGIRIKKGEHDVDPWSVNWSTANLDAYTFYQPPGEQNALGQVKFLFPNKHAVYMHDTPAKHLFDQSMRAFSHGCVRVRNPVKLAEIVLNHDKGWPAGKVQDLVNNGPEDNRVALDNPIPVHITYFTAVPQADGSVKTFADIYGHEKRILLALDGRWGEIDIPPDHLAPIEDREFEFKAAAMERRRDEQPDGSWPNQSSSGSAGNEIEKALKGIFGGF